MSATPKIEWTDAMESRSRLHEYQPRLHWYAETFAERFRRVPGRLNNFAG